jgi:16S rRNA (guanine966-N2)-methyltransferase
MSKRQKRKQSQKQQANPNKNTNSLRIIAGQWRGRKLSFATAPGLRPTPDRVRETLFNWLQGHLHHARCLDLFTGSGALAFEALSRGAGHLTLIENNQNAITQLQANIQLLETENNAKLIQIDAFEFLKTNPLAFDLIFLDPPFRRNFLPRLLNIIIEKRLLTANGLIYLEHEKEEDLTQALNQFELIKEKKAGQVISLLIRAKT